MKHPIMSMEAVAKAKGGLLILLLVWLVLQGALYCHVPINSDEAIFDYLGWRWVSGSELYTEVAEQNFPGKIWVHGLSTWLFGNVAWGYRLVDYIVAIGAAISILTLMQVSPRRIAAWIPLIVYPSMYATGGYWMAGTRDALGANLLVIISAVWMASHKSALPHVKAGLCGFMAFLAVMVRPTYLLFPVGVAVLDLWWAWRSRSSVRASFGRAGIATCTLLLATLITVLMGWRSGQLSEWWNLAVRYNVEVYSHSATLGKVAENLGSLAGSWHWYLLLSAVGGVLAVRERVCGGIVAVAILLTGTALASGFIQKKGFVYHFAGLLPVFGMLVSVSLYLVLHVRLNVRAVRIAAVCGVWGIALLGTAQKQRSQLHRQYQVLAGTSLEDALEGDVSGYANIIRASDYVRGQTDPNDLVFVYSRAVHVNFLAVRASPTRFITVWMLEGMPSTFALGTQWLAELESVLSVNSPAFIVIDAPDGAQGSMGRFQPGADDPALEIVRDRISGGYVYEKSYGSLALYRRKR